MHTYALLRHLLDLGFVVNREKSMLSPAQYVVFLGVSLNSVTFTVRLSEDGAEGFRACVKLFRLGKTIRFSLRLWPLRLMASTS